MSTTPPTIPREAKPTHPFLPVLLVLFVGSGCAALIYEIVWFQMLQFAIGATGVSLGTLLGTFMAGMFLGSLALPRFVSKNRHPLAVYAGLEVGIAILGLLLLILIPRVSSIYGALAPPGFASIFVRTAVCAILLLPPTLLMGATLPAIARYVESTPEGVSWMGFFYGGNIAGAVLGCVLAGFYLLRVHDIATATVVAAVANVVVATIALGLARATPRTASTTPENHGEPIFDPGRLGVYVVIGLSGLTALGSEVVWTRLMSLMLGATTYTFSIILAVYLTGLGLGSGIGSYLAKILRGPRFALGACQLAAVGGIAWTAYWVTDAFPYWPVNPALTDDPWLVMQIDIVRALLAMLPGPVLWGASFPLAVAAAARDGRDPGRLMGGVYAANTIGAVVGALAFGLIAIPVLGTQWSQRLLIGVAALSAGVAFAPGLSSTRLMPDAVRARRIGLATLAFVGIAWSAWRIDAVPSVLISYGRFAPTYFPPRTLYRGEGMNSSITVTELAEGVRNLHVGGKVVASTEPQDMGLQRMLGHMTALLHEEPKTVLVVGFGAGVTAGSFVTHPSVERIVICEIEPLITREANAYFTDVNHDVLNDPRVEIIHDDARHFLFTTDETFDVITADPIHPWMKGAAALYTTEYFELAKKRLAPGGVMTQWVPLYETTTEVVKSELATFFEVFPEGLVWGNLSNGQGYDVVLSARVGGSHINVDGLSERLARPDHEDVVESLSQVGLGSALRLLGNYAGYGPQLEPWLEGSELNRDGNLRLMYLAGLGLNQYESGSIYDEILESRVFPEDVFEGSPGMLRTLRSSLSNR